MILADIVARKKEAIFRLRETLGEAEIEKAAAQAPEPRDFATALTQGGRPAIIAEIKKASPSAGEIRANLEVATIAASYEKEGAAAISVITEEDFFKGSLEYLAEARKVVSLPLLCKDFVVEPIQIFAARAGGADAILLIASILGQETLTRLLETAHSLGMGCLVEVHAADEIPKALAAKARIIGINNRNLKTFQVDLSTTIRLRSLIPTDRLVVSESGIHSRKDLEFLAEAGVDAVLVGTSLMKSEDPGRKLKELMGRV